VTSARACLTCGIVGGTVAPPGGTIAETAHFHAHQDVAYPVPGLVVVAAKRHFTGLDQMTPDEASELLPLAQRVRRAQRAILGIEHAYYFYNEDTTHHFHLWMVPRHPWMARFGRSVESVRPALRHARDTMSSAEDLDAVARTADRLRAALASRAP
jgi:diadenosine tetraphosphate (Ap4A) HIT family hydrolase